MKIIFLSNIPTPYQIDINREINKIPGVSFYSYFLWRDEKNRDWHLNIDSEKIFIADFSGNLTDYKKFYNFFNKLYPDVVLVGGYGLPMANFAILLSKLKKRKVFYWLERPFPRGLIKYIFKAAYLKFKFFLVDGVFAIGISASNIYKKFSCNVYNMPYALDLEEYYKIKKEPHVKVNFLFSGQFIDRKNVINLVRAFIELSPTDATLTLIGSGELGGELNQLAAGNCNINIFGFVEPDDLPKIYSNHDVFILPSKYDGWGVVISEAMAAGMPVISTYHVGAAFEYIEHKKNGYICNSDVDSIKEALSYYLNNKKIIAVQGRLNQKLISASLCDARNFAKFLVKTISD